jgi:hypothetical protein
MNRTTSRSKHQLPRVGAAGLAAVLGLAHGCGGPSPTDGAPAPKIVTAAQVKEMPLEESGDLSVRQNLADPPRRAVIGRDTRVPNLPRKSKGQRR